MAIGADGSSYFLRGVRQQSKEALTDTRKILDLYERGKETIQSTGKRLQAVMPIYDSLFNNPIILSLDLPTPRA